MSTLAELTATLAEVVPALMHGTEPEVLAATDRLLDVIDGPEHFAGVAGGIATLGALSLQQIRAALPLGVRDALLVPAPFAEDEDPQRRTAMQMITCRANDDTDMLLALVKPYAFGDPHTPAECGALIAELVALSRSIHRYVCGGGH